MIVCTGLTNQSGQMIYIVEPWINKKKKKNNKQTSAFKRAEMRREKRMDQKADKLNPSKLPKRL